MTVYSPPRLPATLAGAVLATTSDGSVTAWPRSAERLYGYTEAEAVGRPLEFLYFPGDDPSPGPSPELADPAGEYGPALERHRHKDGTEVWVALAVTTLPGPARDYVLSVCDVTRLVRAETAARGARTALERTRSELRRATARLLSAQEEEAGRISREIHDDLGQRLASLVLDVATLRSRLPAEQVELGGELGQLGERLRGLSDDLRRLSHRLHPAAIERFGLAGALRAHCQDLEQHAGLRVQLDLPGDLPGEGIPLPAEAALGLYRVAQEALENVARHAGVEEATLALEVQGGDLVLTVRDEGAGFDLDEARRGGGLGLIGMKERLGLLGGGVQVESLPGRGTRMSARLPLPVAERQGEQGGAETTEAADRFLGPYRLVEVLGHGALSTVYRAREPEPLGREVALKLHRDTVPGRELRFATERRALTRLDHPNVARVFEAGTTEEGDPYLVMEYVPGSPITTYCDRYRLTLGARLELFLQVCDGVQHAHRKAVLHQDLAPENILVKEEAGEARPKIVDFGTAEGLGPSPAAGSSRSVELPVGAPSYLAPEVLSGGEADVRSDVYSLGVLLDELLSGSVPVTAEGGGSGEHPPPSQRVLQRPSAEGDEEARRRGLRGAPALSRALAGELDWITRRATAPDPEDRYPTASALADDVGRHLRGELVEAAPPLLVYRWRKLARRHRKEVVAALLVALVLVAGLVGTAWQARRAGWQAERAAEQAAIADQVSAFLLDLFEASDPRQSRGEELTAQELLARGTERLDAAFDTDSPPEARIKARLLTSLGAVQRELGAYAEARPLLEEALEIRQQASSPERASDSAQAGSGGRNPGRDRGRIRAGTDPTGGWTWRRASTSWASSTSCSPPSATRSPCTAGPSRSARGHWGPGTRRWRKRSGRWAASRAAGASGTRPGASSSAPRRSRRPRWVPTIRS